MSSPPPEWQYFGPVAREGKTSNQMQVYLENEVKVLASVAIPQRSPDTFGETIRRMRERKTDVSVGYRLSGLHARATVSPCSPRLFEQLEGPPSR